MVYLNFRDARLSSIQVYESGMVTLEIQRCWHTPRALLINTRCLQRA